MPELGEPVKAELERIVGVDRVLLDRESLLRFGCDWTRVYDPDPVAVVLPGSVAEIQAIVRLAADHALAIVPSGGRTGLSGGAVACRGELVLALDRLNGMEGNKEEEGKKEGRKERKKEGRKERKEETTGEKRKEEKREERK